MWNDLMGKVLASKSSMEKKKKLIEKIFVDLNKWHTEQKDPGVAWGSIARRMNNARK